MSDTTFNVKLSEVKDQFIKRNKQYILTNCFAFFEKSMADVTESSEIDSLTADYYFIDGDSLEEILMKTVKNAAACMIAGEMSGDTVFDQKKFQTKIADVLFALGQKLESKYQLGA